MTKIIVDAKSDSNGVTTSVRFKGNAGFTPVETAIRLVEQGKVQGAHVVRPKNANPYIRSNPDSKKSNNIDKLCGDK